MTKAFQVIPLPVAQIRLLPVPGGEPLAHAPDAAGRKGGLAGEVHFRQIEVLPDFLSLSFGLLLGLDGLIALNLTIVSQLAVLIGQHVLPLLELSKMRRCHQRPGHDHRHQRRDPRQGNRNASVPGHPAQHMFRRADGPGVDWLISQESPEIGRQFRRWHNGAKDPSPGI